MILGIAVLILLFLYVKKSGSETKDSGTDSISEKELPREPSISIKAERKIYSPNAAAISAYSKQYNVPLWVIVGVIAMESGGDNNARGSVGEVGLMQISPTGAIAEWRKQFGFPYGDQFFANANSNIQVGTWFLANIHADSKASWINTALHVYQVGVDGYKKGRRSPDAKARFERFSDAVLIRNDNGVYIAL